jgi:hypothetical protein
VVWVVVDFALHIASSFISLCWKSRSTSRIRFCGFIPCVFLTPSLAVVVLVLVYVVYIHALYLPGSNGPDQSRLAQLCVGLSPLTSYYPIGILLLPRSSLTSHVAVSQQRKVKSKVKAAVSGRSCYLMISSQLAPHLSSTTLRKYCRAGNYCRTLIKSPQEQPSLNNILIFILGRHSQPSHESS